MAGIASKTELLGVTAAVLLAGCWHSYQESEDAGADRHAEADAVREADADGRIDVDVIHDVDAEADGRVDGDVVRDAADADAEADVEADGDADGDGSVCDGAWQDLTTGYLWEIPPPYLWMNWDDAVAYCGGLVLCGYPAGSWHLPTISELRSLIRGCPDTMTGGACGVTDSCLGYDLCWSWGCRSCLRSGGPGSDGCYWDPTVSGDCSMWYWSSSSFAVDASYAWYVNFDLGSVNHFVKTIAFGVRCVRCRP